MLSDNFVWEDGSWYANGIVVSTPGPLLLNRSFLLSRHTHNYSALYTRVVSPLDINRESARVADYSFGPKRRARFNHGNRSWRIAQGI